MATIGGQSTPALKPASLKPSSLNQTISGQYARFDVFQLVRLLQQKPGASLGDAWPIDLRLRFRADLRANFTGHEVTRLTLAKAMSEFRHDARMGRKMRQER